MTAAWTSRTSTFGRPVSQVIDRSASRSASRWTASISFWSSASVIGWSGFLRSWLWVVVKPLTSSPAIPMTTWLGRKPAISSASWSATAQLSTTAAMSATVPDCMWREALPLAADAADGAVAVVVDLEDERLGELGPDVERRAGGERLAVVALPDAGARRPLRPPARRRARPRDAIAASAVRRGPRDACPCPGPSRPAAALPSIAATPSRTRSPAEMPRATRSSLTVTKSCGSSASRPSAMTPDAEHAAEVLRGALQRVDRLVRPGEARRAGRPARPPRPAPRARRASGAPAPAARLEPALRLAQLVLERADPVRRAASTVWAPAASAARSQRVDARRARARPRRRRSGPRSGACPSRCCARR